MKDRHLYTIIAAAFLIMGATNLVTLYLYAKEKIQHHKTSQEVRRASDKLKNDSTQNIVDYRKQAQQKFMETVQVLNIAKDEQNKLRQKLVNAMSQRGKHIQALYSTRTPAIRDALKIIQEDGAVFTLYNQYLQISDAREKTLLEKSRPLGAALGIGESRDKQ